MSGIITLAERKRARVESIRAALPRLEQDLSHYARAHGGRFLIYGSAATGRLHYASDVDVIADFPTEATEDALSFAEEAGERYGLDLDLQPKAWCKTDFLKRIETSWRVLS